MRRTTTFVSCLTFGALGLLSQAAEPAPHQVEQDAELRSELLRRRETDQQARTDITEWFRKRGLKGEAFDPTSLDSDQHAEWQKLSTALQQIDGENTQWIKDVVRRRGWPTFSQVGKDGAGAMWLLVQHADADPKFQRNCLELMRALPKDEVSQTDMAYLTDRVLVAAGEKQIYGTQLRTVDGRLQPLEIDDPANVDRLRAELGLASLAEYLKKSEEFYFGSAE